jgi:hypothetical protein
MVDLFWDFLRTKEVFFAVFKVRKVGVGHARKILARRRGRLGAQFGERADGPLSTTDTGDIDLRA